MTEEQTRTMADGSCNVSEDDSLWSMARDFYNIKMLPIIVFIWIWAIVFIAGAVYSGVQFFKVEQTQLQIMYAALFICFLHGVGLIKIFAWQMIHRNNIKRQIRRLELRIAELNEVIKGE